MSRRIPELDGLRCIAIGMVLWCHSNYAQVHVPKTFGLGTLGVDLFFVLSGYLITGIILSNKDRSGFYRAFYMRRALRIWPLYYLVVLGSLAAGAAGLWPAATWSQAAQYLAYLQTILFGAGGYDPLRHTWSLAVEEQFYLIWPPMMCLLRRRWLVCVSVALAVTAATLRAAGYPLYGIATRGDGLAIGSLLAILLAGFPRATGRAGRLYVPGLILVGLLATAWPHGSRLALRAAAPWWSAARLSDARYSLDRVALDFASACLIGLCVCRTGHAWLAPLRLRPLPFLGLISYGIYLFHPAIYRAFGAEAFHVRDPERWRLAASVATTLAVSTASWYAIESPILRLKDRFRYGGPAPGAVARGVAGPPLAAQAAGRVVADVR